MEQSTTTLLTAIIILLLLSAFFSSTETAYSSLNKIKIKNMANNGNAKAEKILKLINNYDKLITTILVGNNIVNIVSSSLATLLCVDLWPRNGVAIANIVLTIVILIFSEITPKALAKEMPETVALAVQPVISLLVFLLTPINALSSAWKKLLSSVFNFKGDDSMSQEELLTIVEEAQQDGDINEHDGNLISNAIEFNELEVKDIYTPRVDVVAININDSLDAIEEKFRENGYSRLPVYNESIDNVIGMIHEKDFYNVYLRKHKSIKSIVQKVVYTNPYIKIAELLRLLQVRKTHLAIVIDEYGGTAGIITLEDILEELVGEIWDEHDEIVEYFKKIDDTHYIVEGNANLEDMFEYFDLDNNEEFDFTTVSSWVIHNFDKIPTKNETFDYRNLTIIVDKADGRTIKSIKIVVNKEENENEKE